MLTPENFSEISVKIALLLSEVNSVEVLEDYVSIVYSKAVESECVTMYANLCNFLNKAKIKIQVLLIFDFNFTKTVPFRKPHFIVFF